MVPARAQPWLALDPQLLAGMRERYDDAVHWGIITNRHRDWPKGNHPGYNLAKRFHDKASMDACLKPVNTARATNAATMRNPITVPPIRPVRSPTHSVPKIAPRACRSRLAKPNAGHDRAECSSLVDGGLNLCRHHRPGAGHEADQLP